MALFNLFTGSLDSVHSLLNAKSYKHYYIGQSSFLSLTSLFHVLQSIHSPILLAHLSTSWYSASSRRIQFHCVHVGDSREVVKPFAQVATYASPINKLQKNSNLKSSESGLKIRQEALRARNSNFILFRDPKVDFIIFQGCRLITTWSTFKKREEAMLKIDAFCSVPECLSYCG